MFDISPVSTASMPLAVPQSIVATPTSAAVSTRFTVVALPAPLSSERSADNNTQGNTAAAIPAAEEQAQATSAATAVFTAAVVNAGSSDGSSAPFLAQMISQGASQENDQIALSYSFSRFAPALQYNALLGDSLVKYGPSNAGISSAYAEPATSKEDEPAETAATVANDYRAYSATQTRNQSNLADTSSQLAVAG